MHLIGSNYYYSFNKLKFNLNAGFNSLISDGWSQYSTIGRIQLCLAHSTNLVLTCRGRIQLKCRWKKIEEKSGLTITLPISGCNWDPINKFEADCSGTETMFQKWKLNESLYYHYFYAQMRIKIFFQWTRRRFQQVFPGFHCAAWRRLVLLEHSLPALGAYTAMIIYWISFSLALWQLNSEKKKSFENSALWI